DARDRYNRVSRTITHLLDAWNRTTGRHDPSFGAALGSGPEARGLMQSIARRAATPEFHAALLETRILQFMAESYEHVPRAAEALVAGDLHAFAVQVARSQAWAERALGNQVPETITLVQLALAEGAVAASAFGAGFGGSVWAMVPQADVTPFMERWRAGYVAAFPMHGARSHFFATRPGTPAFELTAV
nr:hypothetical protein [Gemmatimonadaceae bacterium]